MGRFVEFLLVTSVTVGVMSAFAPDMEQSEFGDVEQMEFDDAIDNPVVASDEAEDFTKERTSLLEEIDRLQEMNDNLKSDNKALKRDSVERQAVNVTMLGRPADCTDLLLAGATQSGVYDIYPFACKCGSSIRVYCDMDTDGGGWTVLMSRQRQELQRQEGQLDFNRTWEEYKVGFGMADGEHWMGNEPMHLLTSTRSYTVRVDMLRTAGDTKVMVYNDFQINNEVNRYKLTLGSRMPESTTTYDCYIYNRNRYFTTYDRDYDSSSTQNCAVETGGGFWFYDCRIKYPPTGIYDGYLNSTCYISSSVYQVSNLQMKIRPTICESTYKRINLANVECGECGEPVPQ